MLSSASRQQLSRHIRLVGGLLLLSLGVATECLASGFHVPPPREALQLLDLLSSGKVEMAGLRALLRSVLDEQYGTKPQIGIIIRHAILQGALDGDQVFQAMLLEGCPPTGDRKSDSCYHLRSAIWPHGTVAGEVHSSDVPVASAAPAAVMPESRAVLMATRADVVANNDKVREPYVRGLVEHGGSPVRRSLEILAMRSLDQLEPEEDRDTVRCFAPATTPGGEIDVRALRTLQRDVRGTLYSVLSRTRPTDTLVAEVRAVPAELVQKGLEGVMTGEMLTNLQCIVEAWRRPEQRPDEWQAWKDVLVCKGWF